MLSALFQLFSALIDLAVWLIIIDVVMQLLVQFNLLNSYHPLVRQLGAGLRELTWYLYRPFRWVIARLIGHQPMLDLSPLLAILALHFLRNLLIGLLAG
jgi:YggT family protein